MNVAGDSKSNTENVLPLFGQIDIPQVDPLEELLAEAESPDLPGAAKVSREEARLLVTENQFPDQSMYTLDKQLHGLREKLNRIKFYLGEIDDLLPK